jgi:hypothetical protein
MRASIMTEMREKVVIHTTSNISDQIKAAMNEGRVLHFKGLGWMYLSEWPQLRNPQNGKTIPQPTKSRCIVISEGRNDKCPGDHADFIEEQKLNIQELDIPELPDKPETNKTYYVYEPEENLVFTFITFYKGVDSFYEGETTSFFSTISGENMRPNRELKRYLETLPAFIEEVYNWESLRTPSDTDNPHPRLLKLTQN